MATKSKTTTKPRTAKETVKGSTTLKQNKINWKFIIVLLVLVTAVGGYFAYRSQVKAVDATWGVKTQPPISNSGGIFPKADGSAGWEGGINNWIKIRANITTANYNKQRYCASGKAEGKFAAGGTITYVYENSQGFPPSNATYYVPAGNTYNVCYGPSSPLVPVGGWVDLYVCGNSTETRQNMNKCTTNKVNGYVKVQNFYRP